MSILIGHGRFCKAWIVIGFGLGLDAGIIIYIRLGARSGRLGWGPLFFPSFLIFFPLLFSFLLLM